MKEVRWLVCMGWALSLGRGKFPSWICAGGGGARSTGRCAWALPGRNAFEDGRCEGVLNFFISATTPRGSIIGHLGRDWSQVHVLTKRPFAGGMWSVVTLVTPGAHEFKFIVDGEWKHSNRHPTIGIDETSLNNVRMVLPEPQYDGAKLPNEPAATPLAKAPKSVSNTTKTPSDAGTNVALAKSSWPPPLGGPQSPANRSSAALLHFSVPISRFLGEELEKFQDLDWEQEQGRRSVREKAVT